VCNHTPAIAEACKEFILSAPEPVEKCMRTSISPVSYPTARNGLLCDLEKRQTRTGDLWCPSRIGERFSFNCNIIVFHLEQKLIWAKLRSTIMKMLITSQSSKWIDMKSML
jgi:hypothetical protein